MTRLKIYFSYDGTRYNGWQRQKNTPHTVQEVLENKFSTICVSKVSIMASGRTDAGVHARIQVAHVDFPHKKTPINDGFLEKLKKGLNSILPRDIRVYKIEKTRTEFHALKDVKKKTYLYFIDTNSVQFPALRHYAWHLRNSLDWEAIMQATKLLEGTHDFRAFCSAHSKVKSTERTIFEAEWGKFALTPFFSDELHAFRITGDGFLMHMVRSIVGTLIYIGNGRGSPKLISQMLEDKNRHLAGITAPAHGLWLWDVLY